MHFTATFRANPPPQAAGTEYFSLDVEDVPAAGSRPDRLFAVSGPQERVLRHTVEQMGDCVPVVPSLVVLVPQMVDQPVVVLQGLDNRSAQDHSRRQDVLRVPLPVEQLVEVPTTPGYALAVVAVQPLGWRAAQALLEQLYTGQGHCGIQILAAATVAEAVMDVSVTTQLQF